MYSNIGQSLHQSDSKFDKNGMLTIYGHLDTFKSVKFTREVGMLTTLVPAQFNL